ncbi:MAG TPA: hypothetical protein VF200_07160 [Woeseiaceae bacterium]
MSDMFRRLALTPALLAAALVARADNLYRDPMRPYAPPAAAASASEPVRYHLSSVLISSQRRVAVINGRVCRVGDRVAGAEVLAIEHERVRLRVGGKEITVAFDSQPPRDAANEQEAAP